MENFPSDLDLKNLIKELSRGREQAMKLQNHLNVQPSSHENCDFLLHKILDSYDHALSMLKNSRPGAAAASGEAPPPPANSNQDSPRSFASDDSDQDFKDQASRKRKAVARWTEKVKVCPETGIEGQLDDGYNWRKYGQKDILGTKYPRGYYRCTHRNGQGCLATKQVQRSDEDPTIFEITYRRKHTCTPRANSSNNNNLPIALADPQNKDPNPLTQNPHEPNFNVQDLGTNENPSFHPFNFPSASTINPENVNIFSDCDNILGNYSPILLPPAIFGSNYFTISTNIIDDNHGGLFPNMNTSESELCPIIASISSTNSPTVGTNFPFSSSELGSNFSFGNPGYYMQSQHF